jgi:hypothetical protein
MAHVVVLLRERTAEDVRAEVSAAHDQAERVLKKKSRKKRS